MFLSLAKLLDAQACPTNSLSLVWYMRWVMSSWPRSLSWGANSARGLERLFHNAAALLCKVMYSHGLNIDRILWCHWDGYHQVEVNINDHREWMESDPKKAYGCSAAALIHRRMRTPNEQKLFALPRASQMERERCSEPHSRLVPLEM